MASSVAAALSVLIEPTAHAFNFTTDNDDLTARWDNTFEYSTGIRVKSPSSQLTEDANLDDGDRNFKSGGLISNRVNLLSEFDLNYKSFGVRLSGAAWYDTVYNHSNGNNSPSTANAASVPFNEFPQDTRDAQGRDVELLDAFVHGEGSIGDVGLTGRVGQHSLLYGESLFFGNNGIAGAQSPVDIAKLLSVPNTQFKELILPVPQLSGQMQLLPNLAVGGYYQVHWERDRLPGVGSYFSDVDILDTGGERILAGPNTIIPGGPGLYLQRTGDIKPKNSGQGGIQIRFRPQGQGVEYGLYAAQFDSKDPLVYVHSGAGFNPTTGQVGTYQLVFPESIKTVGGSFSTTVWDVNVAGEASLRYNMPLQPEGGAVAVPNGMAADNNNNPLYPVGKTMHANLSWVSLLNGSPLWQGGTLLGEIAWNRRLSVSRNASALDPNSTRDAAAIRVVFQPAYFQVLSGLDINVPIGIGYGLFGKSSVINPGFSVYHGGDMSIGINGEYQKVWKFGLNYTHFYGPAAGVIGPPNSSVQAYTYGQTFKDRDFVSLSVQRTF
ncbi:hypothetical protein AYM40_12060 [Paraburkholderia phytofirmans OLGA172]|uniref:DUF1302 domain-containing protein n=2 Tax=Paraburkholderia phytofirmans TaxID=261302 RepID=A0A160FLK3_9BURK|nr:hypothetical protein AYM40_12060 [Paraburkholderia phytofirmans OLGA172]